MTEFAIHYNDSGEDSGAMAEIEANSKEEAIAKFKADMPDYVIINEVEE